MHPILMVSCRAGNYAGRYLLRTRLSGLERLRSQHNNHSHQLPNVKMSIILQISNCVSQFSPASCIWPDGRYPEANTISPHP